ncbi:MAG: iron-containing alcohol dehydrogenase, partial [Anaerotignum sp.]|nr:iron-containing alcohol dehydrogenase [Anaerotignum sp.]
GIAFSHSDVASVHCVAESLGGLYDLPHGTCNAIFLPYVMEYSSAYCLERYADIAKAMGLKFETVQEGARAAVEEVKQLCKDVKLPAFKELGVDKADFEKIAEMSAVNISTESNPRPMSKEDYMNVLNAAYDEVFRQ